MTRIKMTPNEIKVSELLDQFLVGKRRNRLINDKPDYINDLSNGKSLGVEIIEFHPLLNSAKSLYSVTYPISQIDKELKETFKNTDKDYSVIFIIENSNAFFKDQKTIQKILNSIDYDELINHNLKLTQGNEFRILKGNQLSSYGGLIITEILNQLDTNTSKVLSDWLTKYLIDKNNKIPNYEKTDQIGLAIFDSYHLDKTENNLIEIKASWKLAYEIFLKENNAQINFNYIYIVTDNNVIQIK